MRNGVRFDSAREKVGKKLDCFWAKMFKMLNANAVGTGELLVLGEANSAKNFVRGDEEVVAGKVMNVSVKFSDVFGTRLSAGIRKFFGKVFGYVKRGLSCLVVAEHNANVGLGIARA